MNVTLMYDTGARPDDAWASGRWIVPAALSGALVVALFTVSEWLAPTVPLAAYLLLVAAPVLVVAAAQQRVRRLRELAPVALVVLSFALPFVAWNAGPYRMVMMGFSGDFLGVDALVRGVSERSESVASMACDFLMDASNTVVEDRLQPVLALRPGVATRCLERAEERQPQRVIGLGRYLHREWSQGWASPETISVEISCEAADAFEAVSRLSHSPAAPELLGCALGSAEEAVAGCCARALSAPELAAARVEVSNGVHPDVAEALFERLVEVVDLPAARLMAPGAFSEDLSWEAADLFHWTTRLGCDLVQTHRRPDAIATMLSTSVQTQCGLEIESPLYSYAAVAMIERTCQGAARSAEGGRVDVVPWCEAARESVRQSVIDNAMFAVNKARTAYLTRGLEGAIVQGNAQEKARSRRQGPLTVDELYEPSPDVGAMVVGQRVGKPDWALMSPEEERQYHELEKAAPRSRRALSRDLEGMRELGGGSSKGSRQALRSLERLQQERPR
ncbi:hypothetical protein DL240_08030 [Lujinxingia litoralis]|uniref:Uncharacterized protein n=1 Tax=Lujinxingia litoralis TaxID=2211119 RepID=A0A328C706_9DELT|nr:hypothetical protein DL240_08030 [Lujinxingia litoralis]